MRRSITFLLACSLAVATMAGRASAASGPASPPTAFTFFGSGAGHGIGLSQWGSYGLSLRGWTPARILHHFYLGTRVMRVQSPPTGIRVALTTGRSTIHLTARGGAVRLWAGAPGQTRVGTIPTGETWRVIATPAGYAVRDGSNALVGGRRWGGPATDLFATYAAGGARVFVPEADASGAGFEYRRGTLELNLYDCAGGCVERLILQVGFESYLYGLGEVPSSWPIAALRTQAIAARSYALYSIRHFGLRSSCNCHVLDDASDQVYVGWGKEVGADGARWVHAVQATAGTVVTSGGSVIQAFYTASDGGHSENVEDVWHGGDPAFAISYLRGVCDPGENTTANPYRRWSKRFTARQLSLLLRSSTGAVGRITGFSAVDRGESGRIISLQARGTKGNAAISGSELRSDLGLLDTRVWVNSDRTIVGSIRAKYDSLMCAPGLPVSPRPACPAARGSGSPRVASIATRRPASPYGSEAPSTRSTARSATPPAVSASRRARPASRSPVPGAGRAAG